MSSFLSRDSSDNKGFPDPVEEHNDRKSRVLSVDRMTVEIVEIATKYIVRGRLKLLHIASIDVAAMFTKLSIAFICQFKNRNL